MLTVVYTYFSVVSMNFWKFSIIYKFHNKFQSIQNDLIHRFKFKFSIFLLIERPRIGKKIKLVVYTLTHLNGHRFFGSQTTLMYHMYEMHIAHELMCTFKIKVAIQNAVESILCAATFSSPVFFARYFSLTFLLVLSLLVGLCIRMCAIHTIYEQKKSTHGTASAEA